MLTHLRNYLLGPLSFDSTAQSHVENSRTFQSNCRVHGPAPFLACIIPTVLSLSEAGGYRLFRFRGHGLYLELRVHVYIMSFSLCNLHHSYEAYGSIMKIWKMGVGVLAGYGCDTLSFVFNLSVL